MKTPEMFMEYFRWNYPGPDTIIHNPDWHAPKIYAAAIAASGQRELLAACKKLVSISDLWVPTKVTIEHADEAAALHTARRFLLDAIAKAEEVQS